MSIIALWNNNYEQAGKTLASVAIATKMSIERNFKVLLVSTNYKDDTVRNCYFENKPQKSVSLFGMKNTGVGAGNGIEGLSKLISSGKIEPSLITDYTRVIFKGRLELLTGYIGVEGENPENSWMDYKKISESFPELLRIANQYYDMVIVDVDNKLDEKVKNEIIDMANVNMYVITQRLSIINKFMDSKKENPERYGIKCIPVISKYDTKSKYNKKNLMRLLKVKRGFGVVPYNTLFMENAEEAGVVDMFLKLRNVKDKNDANYIFMDEINKLVDEILMKIQELQMRMG